MGRLLDALCTNLEGGGVATLATFPAADTEKSQSRKSRSGVESENQAMRARLLALADWDGLDAAIVHRLSDDDVAAYTAVDDFTDDNLRAHLRALAAQPRMDMGLPSLHWGEPVVVTCAGCGPVLLGAGHPPNVLACPWCFRRKAGKSYAKACMDCGGGPGSHRCAACYPHDNLPGTSRLVTTNRTAE